MLVRGGTDLAMVRDGPSANAELRQYGRKTRWVVRVCKASSLDAVEQEFGGLAVEEQADGTLVIEDPDYGAVRFRADGVVEAEGRTITPKDFTVSGEATMLAAA